MFSLSISVVVILVLCSTGVLSGPVHNRDGYVHPERKDHRCGKDHRLSNGEPGQCVGRCCSYSGWCGSSSAHCDCAHCTDYRHVVRPTVSATATAKTTATTTSTAPPSVWGDECDEYEKPDDRCTHDKKGIHRCDVTTRLYNTVVRCGDGQRCGNCQGFWNLGTYLQEITCYCIPDVSVPRFPTTGRVSWMGDIVDNCYECDHEAPLKRYPLEGELHVTEDGKYLYKGQQYSEYPDTWTNDRATKKTLHMMIISHVNGTFTEYKVESTSLNGTQGESVCTKRSTTEDARTTLDHLWKLFSKVEDTEQYHFEGEPIEGKQQKWGITKEDWSDQLGGESSGRKWSMTVEKTEEGVAKPLEFFDRDDDGGRMWTTNLKFQYSPTAPFDTKDICDHCDCDNL